MPHVTFVHGLANKPPADTLIRLWVEALERDNPRGTPNPGLSLDNLGTTYSMVYWADVLYPAPDTSIETQEGYQDERTQIESISTRDSGARERAAAADQGWRSKLSADERQMVQRLEQQLRFEEKQGPSVAEARVAAAAIVERIPLPEFLKKPLMERLLRDLHHYFYDVKSTPRPGETFEVRPELKRRFLAAVNQVSDTARPHIVVSHSMGTIIAYDCIRHTADCPRLDGLLTVGSPLGLDEVQDHLKVQGARAVDFPFERLTGPWINVYDSLDPVVGFDPAFANDYRRDSKEVVADRHEANWGWWRHNIVKYLSGPKLRGMLRELLVPAAVVRVATGPTRRSAAAARESMRASPAPDLPSAEQLKVLSRAELSDIARKFAATVDPSAHVVVRLVAFIDRLRAQRLHEEVLQLAESRNVKETIASHPKLARLLGQSMIECSRLDDAETLLKPVASRKGDDPEALEARGLLGRIAKQRYVDARAAGHTAGDQAREAVDRYLNAYEKSKLKEKPAWHGINAVAMLRRANRDGVKHKSLSAAPRIAVRILKPIEARFAAGSADYWDLATAGEAYLALGKPDLAELWFRRYAAYTGLEPFALASTLRQLKEVWRLRLLEEPGRQILPPLERALSREAQTAIVAPEFVRASSAAALEKVFGDAAFISPEKLLLGLERCKAVGRVETTANEGFGTGFAVPGARLSGKLDGDYVFVTNAHVVSEKEPDALRPASAKVTFHSLTASKGKPFQTSFLKILATSPPEALDYTVLSLKDQPKKLQAFPLAPTLPTVSGKAQVYVIGHPRGGGMMFSLQENKLVDHGAPSDSRVHYRAPTEPGSSGSPVFNTSWELIALHHSGSAAMEKIHGAGIYEANEGHWIQAIIEDMKSKVR